MIKFESHRDLNLLIKKEKKKETTRTTKKSFSRKLKMYVRILTYTTAEISGCAANKPRDLLTTAKEEFAKATLVTIYNYFSKLYFSAV